MLIEEEEDILDDSKDAYIFGEDADLPDASDEDPTENVTHDTTSDDAAKSPSEAFEMLAIPGTSTDEQPLEPVYEIRSSKRLRKD